MRIDRKLNLTFPVDTEAGTVYVHSMPISTAVFEKYYFPISKVFARLTAEGLSYILSAGPRVAALMLREEAQKAGQWDGPEGVERGLVAEVRRLTNVVVATREGGGWETIPLQEAITRKLLDDDDVRSVEGLITFFTCSSAMMRRDQTERSLDGIVQLWQAEITSSSLTEYVASLPTSTATASSGETATTSSVPS